MNQPLIEKLARGAGAEFTLDIDHLANSTVSGVTFDDRRKFDEFVKMLVAECIKVSTETADRFESTQPDVAYGIRRNINNVIHHFGVEQ